MNLGLLEIISMKWIQHCGEMNRDLTRKSGLGNWLKHFVPSMKRPRNCVRLRWITTGKIVSYTFEVVINFQGGIMMNASGIGVAATSIALRLLRWERHTLFLYNFQMRNSDKVEAKDLTPLKSVMLVSVIQYS